MRLRLLVRRHNLPNTAIVWAIDTSIDITISQLLEQVNEIIPLESDGDWGLEDYAVEVQGNEAAYECLHFQSVKNVLHEDDEVVIRPLLTQDLRQRRIAGRNQITFDGRHLLDGFVFGRPRPRALVDRPQVVIPPRKRRRIMSVDEEAEAEDSAEENLITARGANAENENRDRQLIVNVDFEDEDEEDEEDDEDFQPDDEEDDEDQELPNEDDELAEEQDREIHEESESAEDEELGEGVLINETEDNTAVDEEETTGEDEAKRQMKKSIRKLEKAFPTAPTSIIKHVLLSCEMDVGSSWDTLQRGFRPVKPRGAVEMEQPKELYPRKTREAHGQDQEPKRKTSLVLEDDTEVDLVDEDGEPFPGEYENPLLDYYDEHGLPPGSIIIGKGLSDTAKNHLAEATKIPPSCMANKRSDSIGSSKYVRFSDEEEERATPAQVPVNPEEMDLDDESESGDEDFAAQTSSEISSSEASSSESSEQDSGSDSESDDATSSSGSDTDTSSSGSDSDSDSDSEPEETSSKAPGPSPALSKPPPVYSQGKKTTTTPTVPPGEGRRATKARNQRRRMSNILQRFKDKRILPAGVTLREFGQMDINSNTTLDEAAEVLAAVRAQKEIFEKPKKSKKAESKAAEFEVRRQQLLASLASGGIEIIPELLKKSSKAKSSSPDTDMADHPKLAGDVDADAEIEVRPIEAPAAQIADTAEDKTPDEKTKRQRAKLDLGAGRRILFGALGMKNPKNKTDEDKLRNDLMKLVKPVKPVASEVPEPVAPVEDEDPDAWREKINLRAVECCQEGVKLSAPPFPFVQRWDPQQQYYHKGKGGGKGKRNQRNQTQFYNEEESASATKKRKRHPQDEVYESYDQDTQYNAYEESYGNDFYDDQDIAAEPRPASDDVVDGQIQDQLMRDVEGASVLETQETQDDLPFLPDDLSSLPDIKFEELKPGMVIAFKQLVMSEATQWQPIISDYRTAVVNIVSDSGEAEVTLAKRDREVSEKYYDHETGDRIYGKFDMPDDEEGEGEDDGFRALAPSEMIEPKLVQGAPEELNRRLSGEISKSLTSASDSTTMEHEEVELHQSIEIPSVINETLRHESSVHAISDFEPSAIIEEDSPMPDEPDAESTPVPGVISRAQASQDPEDIVFHNADEIHEITNEDELPVISQDHSTTSSEINILSSSLRNAELQIDAVHDISISEETRAEISVIIKEAGFRTDVPSSVLRARPRVGDLHSDAASLDRLMRSMIGSSSDPGTYSPKFNGFGSSPSRRPVESEVSQEQIPEIDLHPASEEDATASVQYPELTVSSSRASQLSGQVSDNGRQPDFPTPGDDTMAAFEGYDTFAQNQSERPEPYLPTLKTEPIIKPRSQGSTAPIVYDIIHSDPEFPSLEELFATARSSIRPGRETTPRPLPATNNISATAAAIDKEYREAMERLDAEIERSDDPDQVTPKASQNQKSSGLFLTDDDLSDEPVSSYIKKSFQSEQSSKGTHTVKDTRGRPKSSSTKLSTFDAEISPPSSFRFHKSPIRSQPISNFDGNRSPSPSLKIKVSASQGSGLKLFKPSPYPKPKRLVQPARRESAPFKVPPNSQQIDLTFSSDDEVRAPPSTAPATVTGASTTTSKTRNSSFEKDKENRKRKGNVRSEHLDVDMLDDDFQPPLEPDDSNDDNYFETSGSSLPKGPGWVEKIKTAATRRTSYGETRSAKTADAGGKGRRITGRF